MSSIDIYRGGESVVNTLLFREAKEIINQHPVIWIGNSEKSKKSAVKYWSGFCQLLHQMKDQLGKKAFEAIVAKNMVGASLLLDEVEMQLDSSALEKRKSLFATLTSNLSQNYFLQQPLYIELGKLLVDLLKAYKGFIVIPNIEKVDAGTISLLLNSYRHYQDGEVHLKIGLDQRFDDNWINNTAGKFDFDFDENGIIWNFSDVGIKNFVLSFLFLGANLKKIPEQIHGEDQTPNLNQKLLTLNEKIADQEMHLCTKIHSNSSLNQQEIDGAYYLITRSFEVFDFLVALNVGLLCLEKEITFTAPQLARVHMIVALCTHNIQFSTVQGNHDTNDFIREHNIKALALLDENAIESAFIYYRLAVLHARRKSELEEGRHWVEKCIAVSSKISSDEGKYSLAWGYNIRAYINARQRDKEKAFADAQQATTIIQDLMKARPYSRDINFSYVVFNDNLSSLFADAKDIQAVKRCLQLSSTVDGYQNWNIAMNAKVSIGIHKEFLRTDLSVEDAKIGLKASQVVLRPTHYNLYLKYLSAFYYRLGEMENCYNYTQQTLSLLKRFKDWEQYASIAVEGAKYMTVGDKIGWANDFFEIAMQHEKYLPGSILTICTAYKALHSAKSKDLVATEKYINRAIELVTQNSDHEHLTTLVSSIVFDTCMQLQAMAEAKEILQQLTEEITLDAINESSDSFLPIRIILQQFTFSNYRNVGSDYLGYMIENLPVALQNYSDAWWYLKDFLAYLTEALNQNIYIESLYAKELDYLLLASSQRMDCNELITKLLETERFDLAERLSTIKESTSGSLDNFLEHHFDTEKTKRFAEF